MRSAWTQAVVLVCKIEKEFQVLRKQKWQDLGYNGKYGFNINTLEDWSKLISQLSEMVHILYLQINTNPIHVFEVDNHHCYN